MLNFRKRVALVTIMAGLLTACTALQQRFPILGLLVNTSPKPPALSLRAETISALPQYQPVSFCQYNARMSDGISGQDMVQTLRVREVRDRLLVTSVVDAEESTALISRSGQKYDFNAADSAGARFTPESSKGAGGNGAEMNNIDLIIPSFVSGPVSPGQIASRLTDSRGIVQAAYVYRGLSIFRDREVILLDLVRIYNGTEIGRSIGFSIVDRARALPILFAAGGNPSIRSEQTTCRN